MAKYKLTQKTDANGTTQDIVLDASCVDGVVKTVNNTSPDANGNVNVSGGQATDVQINGTSITSSNVADIKTNGTYNASSNKIATMSDIPTSINGMSGGQLTSALYLSGGDAVSGVANIQLDTNGQITAKDTTSTLFGRSNASTLLCGHSSHSLLLRGSATRPTYNGNDIALYSDIP